MAAPHVAGVVALMLEANPTLTPDQVKALLVASATPMAACPVAACGAGGVDALGAVQGALAQTNHAPVAALTASPSVGPAPLDSRLDASGSIDWDGSVVAYKWDIEGSGQIDVTTSTPVLEHTYPAGTHHPTVTVVDDDGASSAPVSVAVVVADPPTAVASAPKHGKSGQAVTFDGSSSTPGGSPIVSWHWDFGDGTSVTSSSAFANHAYAVVKPQVFEWSLVVTDANGITSAAPGSVKVTP
jgi:PKD repeat protein